METTPVLRPRRSPAALAAVLLLAATAAGGVDLVPVPRSGPAFRTMRGDLLGRKPHTHEREMARRRRQIARGIIRVTA